MLLVLCKWANKQNIYTEQKKKGILNLVLNYEFSFKYIQGIHSYI